MSSRAIALLLCIGCAADCEAAATASGRNWRIAIESIHCEESLLTLATRIRYLGPKGPVEAPVIRLLDGDGKPHLPRSLAWKGAAKPAAEWLSAAGLRNIQSEDIGEIQIKWDARAPGELRLEFGDIRAFPLTRKRTSGCEGLLQLDQIQAPRAPRAAEGGKAAIRVYRNAYPCLPQRTIEAEYPPYLPRQLLLFGRGYLPSARHVDLPMGLAPAQPYSYAGPDELNAVEERARRALATDFPQYAKNYFAFNWGPQKGASGNELYSIGVYEVRPCPK